MTKICKVCNIEKDISEFAKHKTCKLGVRNICKQCTNKITKNEYDNNPNKFKNRTKKHIKKYPWKRTLSIIKQRCNNSKNAKYHRYGQRGIKCLITEEELKLLWFRDKAYEMQRPSIDRIDNDGHYELNNCRFIEQSENTSRTESQKVLQYDLNGKLIKEWPSYIKAAKELNIQSTGISDCVNGRLKTSGRFIWRKSYGRK